MHIIRQIFNYKNIISLGHSSFETRLGSTAKTEAKTSQATVRIMTTTNNNNNSNNNNHNNLKPSLDGIELCKANAAWAAVDDYIDRDCIVGIGSGSTMRYVLERMKHVCQEKNLAVRCIPTSFQAKQLIYEYGLPLAELEANPEIDVTIDGADEVNEHFVAIKGGGACLAQEKVIAFAAKKFIVVADYRKDSVRLCDNWTKGIPIEVLPMASNAVRHHLVRKFKTKLGDLMVRMGKEKAGPVITDNGNFVIDWKFERTETTDKSAKEWKQLSDQIKIIPGVVETGIFAGMIHAAYFGLEHGDVTKRIASETDLF